jgi:hypothetical protein
MKTVTPFLLTLISFAALGQKGLVGYYSSNAAEMGFFVTTIQLQKDSTFQYSSSGDLLHNDGRGRYTVDKKNILHFTFDPKPQKDSVALLEEALSGGPPTLERLLYKHGKLYSFHITEGHVVRRGQAISRRKKFLFWGERYLTRRRLFLKKRKGRRLE